MITEIDVWIRKKSSPQKKTMGSHGVIRVMESRGPATVVVGDDVYHIDNTSPVAPAADESSASVAEPAEVLGAPDHHYGDNGYIHKFRQGRNASGVVSRGPPRKGDRGSRGNTPHVSRQPGVSICGRVVDSMKMCIHVLTE